MKSEEEIREQMKEIMEKLRYNDKNHNLSVHLENALINEYKALEWVLESEG